MALVPTSLGLDNCFPYVTLEGELVIKYQSKMFMLGHISEFRSIKKYRRVVNCISFLREL